MEESSFEALDGGCTTVGDTRLPDLAAGESWPLFIGKCGRIRKRCQNEHHPVQQIKNRQ